MTSAFFLYPFWIIHVLIYPSRSWGVNRGALPNFVSSIKKLRNFWPFRRLAQVTAAFILFSFFFGYSRVTFQFLRFIRIKVVKTQPFSPDASLASSKYSILLLRTGTNQKNQKCLHNTGPWLSGHQLLLLSPVPILSLVLIFEHRQWVLRTIFFPLCLIAWVISVSVQSTVLLLKVDYDRV